MVVETSDRAELRNCIQNAQDCTWKMGELIEQAVSGPQKENLKRLCYETGILLEEARQRCNKLL